MTPTRSASSAGSSSAASRKARTSAASSSPKPPLDRPAVRLRRSPTSRAGCTARRRSRPTRRPGSRRTAIQPYCANGPPWMVSSTGCGPGPGRRGDPAVHRVAVRARSRSAPASGAPGRSRRSGRAELGQQPAPPGGERDQLAGGPVVGDGGDDDARRRPPNPRTVNGPSTSVSGGPPSSGTRSSSTAPRRWTPTSTAPSTSDGRRRLVAAVVLRGVEQRLQRPAVGVHPARHGLPGDEVEPVRPEVGHGGDDDRPAVAGEGGQGARRPATR